HSEYGRARTSRDLLGAGAARALHRDDRSRQSCFGRLYALARPRGRATGLAGGLRALPAPVRAARPTGPHLVRGERQMLALGRALMANPRLLLLDEPSLGLAPLIVREIFRIVTGLRELGVSILLVEQNARAALETAD